MAITACLNRRLVKRKAKCPALRSVIRRVELDWTFLCENLQNYFPMFSQMTEMR